MFWHLAMWKIGQAQVSPFKIFLEEKQTSKNILLREKMPNLHSFFCGNTPGAYYTHFIYLLF